MAHEHDTHVHAHGSDRKAAFLGLIIGVIVLFAIVRTIIALTNARYSHERPAAEATK
ncbi:MAG TPA: hypothetical protein VN706_20560 [Gemmatimonadaceae bacterium]|nr:hypothetical protein [Gemmatimonadaceae bacterium]